MICVCCRIGPFRMQCECVRIDSCEGGQLGSCVLYVVHFFFVGVLYDYC